jgi:uncharacterized membrane protein YfcA
MLLDICTGLILSLSGFTMSFAGFGFALVSVPLLALFIPVREAVAMQFPFCFALFAYQAWHYRRHFFWTDMKDMVWGFAVGIVLGTTLLFHLPGALLKKVLAVFIASVVLFNMTPAGQRFRLQHAHNPWWGHWCGFLSGSFFGAYTIGGPPAALYILSVQKDPLRAKSFLAFFFSLQFFIIAVIYTLTGLISLDSLKTSIPFTPAVVAGSALGFYGFRRASSRSYQKVVDWMLLATSMALWWRG